MRQTLKARARARAGDVQKYDGTPAPSVRMHHVIDPYDPYDLDLKDDVSVCLNCPLPPERCRGTDECYLKRKEEKEREN